MKKIYLADNYENHDRMQKYADFLSQGFEIVSTWHNPDVVLDAEQMIGDGHEAECLQHAAFRDLQEIDECDIFMIFNHDVSKTGGKHFETGYAYAQGKQIVLDGPRTNVFHFMESI